MPRCLLFELWWYPCRTSSSDTYRCLLVWYIVAAHLNSLMWLYARKKSMARFFSLIPSGCNTERQCGNLGDNELSLDTTCSGLFALLLLSVYQFQIVSSNWFANGRWIDIAFSALSIDGKFEKKISCTLWLSTWHRVSDKRLRNVVL